METLHEDATEGGPKGPSESVWNDQDAMDSFARLLGELVVSHRGGLTPEAQAQFDIRNDEERGQLLSALVAELQPNDVAPAVWLKWLNGGESPFNKALKKPVKLSHSVKKELTRGAASTRQQRQRVADLEDELALAKERLSYQEAMDKSLLEWSITDQLIKLMAPMFAMGPAWTLMRSISSHLSDEEAADQTAMLKGEMREKLILEIKESKIAESDFIFEGLDFWSGNIEFENDLRKAIVNVIKGAESRRQEWTLTGRRRRPKDSTIESVNPDATFDAEEILDGLRRG